MKREILFRGKRVDNGEWVHGKGLQQCKDELGNEIVAIFTDIVKSEKYTKKEGRYTLYYMPVKAETLGQFTGLKDKNGKKIFEGDILRLTGSPSNLTVEVVYNEEDTSFILKLTSINEVSTRTLGSWQSLGYECAIIGSVYDNPELMKGDRQR